MWQALSTAGGFPTMKAVLHKARSECLSANYPIEILTKFILVIEFSLRRHIQISGRESSIDTLRVFCDLPYIRACALCYRLSDLLRLGLRGHYSAWSRMERAQLLAGVPFGTIFSLRFLGLCSHTVTSSRACQLAFHRGPVWRDFHFSQGYRDILRFGCLSFPRLFARGSYHRVPKTFNRSVAYTWLKVVA